MIDLSSLGVGTSAVWTRAAASRLISSSAIDKKLATEWQSPYPGVLADAGFDLDPVQWATAGVLASGGEGQPFSVGAPDDTGAFTIRIRAAACGRDAARVWGFPLIDDDDPATGALDRFEHDVLTWHLTRDLTAPVLGDSQRPHVLHRHSFQPLTGDLVQHASGCGSPHR